MLNIRFVAPLVFLLALAAAGCADSDPDAVSDADSAPRATSTAPATAPVAVATTVPSEPTVEDVIEATVSPTVVMQSSPTSSVQASSTSGAGPDTPQPTATTIETAGGALYVPEGLTISVFAEGLGSPRFMAIDDSGVVHVADRAGGRILRLPDEDGDGSADAALPVLDNLNSPHSLAFYDGYLYVAEEHQVVRSRDADSDGTYDAPEPVIENLPTGGHWSRTIVFGPDGLLYLSVGSSCNVCEEDEEIRATISRYNPDGTNGEIIATGLRNAVGLAFSPDGVLYATNNGRDMLGDDLPPENIYRIEEGVDYGWPRCHSGDIVDPDFGGEGACQGVGQPVVEMQAHSAPLGLTFYTGDGIGSYDGDMFVAFHGSWNRTVPTGYKVVRIPFEDGQPTGEVVDFVTGWLRDDGDSWGRPVDVLVAADGSLLISDDAGGRVYRVSPS